MRRSLRLAALIAVLLFVLTAGAGVAGATVLLGNDSVSSMQDQDAAGLAEAFNFSASTSGSAQSISVYVDRGSSASGLVVGLYADNGGQPGSLLASGSSSAPTAGEWNDVRLDSTPTLSSGATYWLALLGTGGQLNFRDGNPGTGNCSENSAQSNLTSLPSSWTRGATWSNCSLSADVNGTPSSTTTSAPASTGLPVISGTAQQGQTLTASNGSWTGSPTSYAYQWQDCHGSGSDDCASISGATASSYTLASGDIGHTVRSVVTATNSAGSASATSAATAPVTLPLAPTASFGYSPAGPVTGQSVHFDGTASMCAVSPCSYSWADDPPSGGSWPLGSGRSIDFTFVDAATKYVTLTVTDGLNRTAIVEHDVVVTSAAAPVPLPLAPTASFGYSPASPVTGQSVHFDGTASTCAVPPCTYTWADEPPAGGSWPLGSGVTIDFTFSDAGTKYVTLTITDALNRTASVEHSVVVSAGTPSAPSNTAAPAVSGSAQQGQTLTTSNGSWANGPTSYAYEWQDCNSSGSNCASIGGATSNGYTLVSGDVGHTVRSVVTASNAGGSASASSSPTSLVVATGGGSCAFLASSVSAIQTDVTNAADGQIVCVTAGSYGALTLTRPGSPADYVTVEPVIGTDPNGAGKVTFTGAVDLRGPWVKFSHFYTTAGIDLATTYGGSPVDHIYIDHNDINAANAGDGISGVSEDCSAPDAPSSSCSSYPPITNITINGNRIYDCAGTAGVNGGPYGSGQCDDAINLNSVNGVTISNNDIYNIVENGNGGHQDNLQTTWGAGNVVFDHNYLHDSHAEPMILKDGDIVNATWSDNLVVRQNIPDASYASESGWLVDTHNSILRNNTFWSNNGGTIFMSSDNAPPTSCSGDPFCSPSPYSTSIDHNIFESVATQYGSGLNTTVTAEGNNIWSSTPSTFTPASTDSTNTNPTFKCSTAGPGGTNICGNGTVAGDDYELTSDPNNIGIDWAPANVHYGP